MAFVKEESADFRIEETFSIKQEDPEEQTDMMALKEESQEMNAAEEKSIKTENTSSGNGAQEPLEPYICGQCGKSFRCKRHIYKHMRLIHSRQIICKNGRCKRTFPDWKRLKEHVKTHIRKGKPFMCLYCAKDCFNQGRLAGHVRVHTREKPFPCEHCGKKFAHKSNLISHMRTHTGERPFVCLQCAKSFTQKGALKDHIRLHTGEKPFICKECGKSFVKKQSLKIHMHLHTGEKPHKCLWCEESYMYAKHLKEHLRTHSRKRTSVTKEGHN